jgi:hypothetical protein
MAARAEKLFNIHDKMEMMGMRTLLRFLPVAALLAAAVPASAQIAVSGLVTQPACAGLMDPAVEKAELIGVKVAAATGTCTDILFDFRQTGGLQVGGATAGDAINQSWQLPPNWTNGQLGTDAHFALLVYPPVAGSRANRMAIDSGSTVNGDFAAAVVQTVGNSIPMSYAGTQGIDLNLSGAGYSVRLRGPTGLVTTNFPLGANGGIEVAFAPLAEVNATDISGGGGCYVAGETRNPAAPADPQVDGVIIGYNVYRLSGVAGPPPTASAFYTASLNADVTDGWQYFMPLTQGHNLGSLDTDPLLAGTPSPSDTAPNDLSGLQNVDGVMYSGDEVMIYQDSAANRGVSRGAQGSAPVGGTGYWYAFQPVLCGDVGYYSVAHGFGASGSLLNGDHGSSLSSMAAGDDSIDLDLDGNMEFFSPQADAGQPGLGLTYPDATGTGLPVLSEPVFGQMDPLAAGGGVTLSGRIDGTNVNITFQTGLEAGDVQGFNVYRGVADARVRVNEQLILVQGTESSVYQLVDDAVQARRLSRGGTVQYTVEIVYTDGHTSDVGPFSVTLGSQAPARRAR